MEVNKVPSLFRRRMAPQQTLLAEAARGYHQGVLKGSFNRLQASIQTIKGVGPVTAKNLRARQIETLEDCLFFLPVRYQDRRQITPIRDLEPGQEAVVAGRIVSLKKGRPGRHPLRVTIEDETGRLVGTWFHFHRGTLERLEGRGQVILVGRVDEFKGQATLVHPEMIASQDASAQLGRFVPIYRDVPGVSAQKIRSIIQTISRRQLDRLKSPLPRWVIDQHHLLDLNLAFRRVHFPENEIEASINGPPRQTLIFTELFLFQAGLALSRHARRLKPAPILEAFDQTRRQVTAGLPFSLTRSQERVLDELAADLTSGRPMNRLLQGDVGSGKTVLAAVALLAAALSGRQGAFMAPTEILAEQHLGRLGPLSQRAGVFLSLLTGSTSPSERRTLLADLAAGRPGLLIGTHALFQDRISFTDLGLVVIDEQHRFGVLQRAGLRGKGANPHVLVMTATPIPRSLCLTLYGDLDISILDEKPPGRQEVVTRVLSPQRVGRAWRAIKNAVAQGLQAYVVLPAIEASEGLSSAEERFAQLKEIMSGIRLGLLHGRLSKDDQVQTMARFAEGQIDVLVATTMVEVGLDVAKAAVMVIENAERFGLAQIHQLRGRVGRGGSPAACLLISEAAGQAAERLKLLEETEDGFKIAEADLNFRGPGELLGARQAGWPDFRLANLVTDARLLKEARQAAFELIRRDPDLNAPEHEVLNDLLTRRWLRRIALSRVG